jgi:hypothetical protein
MPPSPQEFTACPSPRDSKDAKGRIFIGCYRPLTGCTVAVFWANQFVTLIKINIVGGNFVGSPDHVPITVQRMGGFGKRWRGSWRVAKQPCAREAIGFRCTAKQHYQDSSPSEVTGETDSGGTGSPSPNPLPRKFAANREKCREFLLLATK